MRTRQHCFGHGPAKALAARLREHHDGADQHILAVELEAAKADRPTRLLEGEEGTAGLAQILCGQVSGLERRDKLGRVGSDGAHVHQATCGACTVAPSMTPIPCSLVWRDMRSMLAIGRLMKAVTRLRM